MLTQNLSYVVNSFDTFMECVLQFFTFFTNLILDHAVQALAAKEVELSDSAPYFLDSAERLAQPGFLPSDEDILRCLYVTIYIHILLKRKIDENL